MYRGEARYVCSGCHLLWLPYPLAVEVDASFRERRMRELAVQLGIEIAADDTVSRAAAARLLGITVWAIDKAMSEGRLQRKHRGRYAIGDLARIDALKSAPKL
jgi:hypothetical protein